MTFDLDTGRTDEVSEKMHLKYVNALKYFNPGLNRIIAGLIQGPDCSESKRRNVPCVPCCAR